MIFSFVSFAFVAGLLEKTRRFIPLTLLGVVVIGMLSIGNGAGRADSSTPDEDGNGFNNSFDRAVDIGTLQPAGVNIREQLGVVPWGTRFDTRDFYKFVFPTNGVSDFQLAVRLNEQPPTTMWINVYDQSRKLIYESQGSSNEEFRIPLTFGVYYLEVLTSREVANGRNLVYVFNARPIEIPLPEKGGTACRGAPDLGVLTEQSRAIEGALSSGKSSSFYSFSVPFGLSLSGNMFGPQPSQRYMLSVIDRLNNNKIPFRNAELIMQGILLDPGFYCMQLESVGSAGYGNYRGQFSAAPAGLRPGNDMQRAQNIIDMELGSLTQNGSYGLVSRYLHYQKPGEIPNVPTTVSYGHPYVIRDWVGSSARSQYYWFRLPGKSRVELRLSNQMASGRAFVEDSQGNVLASTTVDSVNLNPELLPTQSLVTTLQGGERYYIRISYLSSSVPGTSFGLSLTALAAQ